MRYRTLTKNKEFSRIYARGKSYVHPNLVLYVAKNRLGYTRIGLTATKKVGHAVQRNRARRIMRAALSEHLSQNIGGYDIILVARARTPYLKSTQLSKTLAGLMHKAERFTGAISRVLIALVRGYQKVISPLLGHNCRFTPTCSQYMIQAIQVHGPAKGLLLGLWRILRCNPFGKYGYDPVPEKGRWMNPERKLFREKR